MEELILKWKKTKDPKIFEQIFVSLKPIVIKHIKRFEGSGLNQEALELEARRIMAEALEKYKPGQSVHGYINSYLMGLSRFVNNYQNVLRLPESANLQYSTFERTFHDLKAKLRRDPSPVEIADELGWSVDRVQYFMRRKIVSDDPNNWNAVTDNTSLKIKEARIYLASKYGKEAEKMFALIEGLDGPKKSIAQVAREFKMPYHTVYKMYNDMKNDYLSFIR